METAEVKKVADGVATEKRTEPWCVWRQRKRPRKDRGRKEANEGGIQVLYCLLPEKLRLRVSEGLWVSCCGSWYMVLVDQAGGPQKAKERVESFLVRICSEDR